MVSLVIRFLGKKKAEVDALVDALSPARLAVKAAEQSERASASISLEELGKIARFVGEVSETAAIRVELDRFPELRTFAEALSSGYGEKTAERMLTALVFGDYHVVEDTVKTAERMLKKQLNFSALLTEINKLCTKLMVEYLTLAEKYLPFKIADVDMEYEEKRGAFTLVFENQVQLKAYCTATYNAEDDTLEVQFKKKKGIAAALSLHLPEST